MPGTSSHEGVALRPEERRERKKAAKKEKANYSKEREKMSQEGTIRKQNGFWVLRYRITRPEVRCTVCGQLEKRHARKDHPFDGETKLMRVQLMKKLSRVQPEDEKLKNNKTLETCPSDVREEAEKFLGPANRSTLAPEKNTTLGIFVDTVYFPHLESEGMKPSTIAGYRGRWESQLRARIADKRLREFGATEAYNLFREIARDCPTMTRSTLHHFKSFLSSAYRLAIILKYIDGFVGVEGGRQKVHGNPIREASIPRSAPEGAGTTAYSVDELLAMIGLLPEPSKTAVAIAGFTGMRACEIFALKWEDWKDGFLSVERATWNGNVGTLKTKASRAPVEVIEPLQQQLASWRWKNNDPKTGYIFSTRNKTPLDQTNVVDRQILPALNVCVHCKKSADDHGKEKHEFERDASRPEWQGWHAFRRGLATALHAAGVQDQTIQSILRHANVKTTQTCYIKSVPTASKKAMHKFGQDISNKMLKA
jgi:integrase